MPRDISPDSLLRSAPLRAAVTQTSIPAKGWFLLILLSSIWGGSFLCNRIALAEVPVFTMVALRVGLAALALWLVLALRGVRPPRDLRLWGKFFIMGLFNNALPFSLIIWAQHRIDSGLAGILNASTALFTVLVAALLLADERLTLRKGTGVMLGLIGVTIAIGPAALTNLNLGSLSQLAILGSSLSYACIAVYSRGAMKGVPPLVAAAGMMTGASVIMIPAALITEGVPSFDWSLPVWAAVLWLALGASALAFVLLYRTLALVGAGNMSLTTLMAAPIAILLGWAVYGEALAPRVFAGFFVLVAGLLVLDGKLIARVMRRKPRDAGAGAE